METTRKAGGFIGRLMLIVPAVLCIGVNAQTPQNRPSADQVLDEMLKREQPELIPSSQQARDAGQKQALLPDGAPLSDRAGRLSREGDDWLFVFESDSPDNPQPPMKLLRNTMLERMVRQTQASQSPPSFVVSGEVTEYFGENFLLVRMALLRLGQTNISK